MSKIPSLSYDRIVAALNRGGWAVTRQKGSHIRLEKKEDDSVLKLTVPAHRPVKRTTLAKIIKQAGLTIDEFLNLL
ncbi:MAG: addiction module toxin, HicA family [Chloroflexaceae bacterium]|nr:addiction module toxin, HicA family [Chloroflexaceae bacterium]